MVEASNLVVDLGLLDRTGLYGICVAGEDEWSPEEEFLVTRSLLPMMERSRHLC